MASRKTESAWFLVPELLGHCSHPVNGLVRPRRHHVHLADVARLHAVHRLQQFRSDITLAIAGLNISFIHGHA
ncbi:hypothetical protein [Pseudoxanthomonas sp. UTMC 1351]|uniref:hypothetical protein n=1 Tax=Pseudoxanthomonas sp. UTMC 1351 TaxID=2695853 RepID=UPI0034CE2B90